MDISLSEIGAAGKMFSRRISVACNGYKKYSGNDEEICRQIIDDCWNGRFFQGSAGHFNQFWLRDFCFSADALYSLGYKKEVAKTIDTVLGIYSKHNKITTTIFPGDNPVNVFTDSAESLPYLINAANKFAPDLILKYRKFLSEQVREYFMNYINHETGLIRADMEFSGMRDAFVRESACSDNCMLAMLANDLRKIKYLPNPFDQKDYSKIIKDNFWTGDFFKDDLTEDLYLAADANVIPFSTEVFTDKKMLRKIISVIQEYNLDRPFALKYSSADINWKQRAISNLFTPNYEGNTIWANIGMLYISQVAKVDKKLAKIYLRQYTESINKHKNFLELYNPDGSVYKSLFYHADEGMIWAAIYLKLKKDLKA